MSPTYLLPPRCLLFSCHGSIFFYHHPPVSELCLLTFVLFCDWFCLLSCGATSNPPYSVIEDRSQEENKENVWSYACSRCMVHSLLFVFSPPNEHRLGAVCGMSPSFLFYFLSLFLPPTFSHRSQCVPPPFLTAANVSRLQYPSRLGSQCPRDALELARRPLHLAIKFDQRRHQQ